jgi:hypothetical protein
MYDALESNGGRSGGGKEDEEDDVVALKRRRGGGAEGEEEEDKTGDAVLYSASLDNTIRSWDPYDMACVTKMEETASEIR